MEWLSCIKSVIDYIEDNIRSIKSIDEVSDYTNMSNYYLQTGFQVMTGYSIGEYIRNRKLYLASLDILNGKRIIDVALDYGYLSQESFTKAYKKFHGINPSKTRKELIKVFNPLTISVKIEGGEKVNLNYRIVNLFPLKVIGFVKEFNFKDSYKEIPKFWDEICEKYCYPRIYKGLDPINPYEKAIMDNCIGEYGVCLECGGDSFKYLIAGKYCGGDIPDGMMVYEFPKSEWAIFDSYGPCPEKLQELNTRIFKEWLPFNKEFEIRGFGNIEWYDTVNGNMEDEDYHTQIWIPVKRIDNK